MLAAPQASRADAMASAVSIRAIWVCFLLVGLVVYMFGSAMSVCTAKLLLLATGIWGATLGLGRGLIGLPLCENDDCDDPGAKSHLWAQWCGAMVTFAIGTLLLLLAAEPRLATASLAQGEEAVGSLASLEDMYDRQPKPKLFFFRDGYVDLNRSVHVDICSSPSSHLRPTQIAAVTSRAHVHGEQVYSRFLDRRWKPLRCFGGASVSIAAVFHSEEDAARNGTVLAWARSLAWARDSGKRIPASSCTRKGEVGLCALRPETLTRANVAYDGAGDHAVVRKAVRKFMSLNPQCSVASTLPVLFFADPRTALRFPSTLLAALLFYGMSVMLTCCPAVIELCLLRHGFDDSCSDDERLPSRLRHLRLGETSHPVVEEPLSASAILSQRLVHPGGLIVTGGLSRFSNGVSPAWIAAPSSMLALSQRHSARRLPGANHANMEQRGAVGDVALLYPRDNIGDDGIELEPSRSSTLDALQEETVDESESQILDGEEGTVEKCVICCNRRKDTLIAPCGHVCTCLRCSQELRRRGAPCPICRGSISAAYRVYNT